ncbi:DUF1835 domain-containing protein [Paenibacillus psychroresistens]|nr:DUF1835 domain-containing protein [Paenibacillus psychroresistens]
MTVLHIVNGDSVKHKLEALAPGENILVWRESLHEGPILLDLASKEARKMRAAYFKEKMGLPEAKFFKHNGDQYKVLLEHEVYDKIILWFEYDLFDQTMLIYLLDWFSKFKAPQTKLELLCIGEFPGIELFLGLGQLTTAQLATLKDKWQEVTSEQLHLASKAWQVYASSDPLEIERFIKDENLSHLPFLQEAFTYHLERFPSSHNGLSRLEQKTLQLVSEGVTQLIPLFQQISKTEKNYGLGDMQFWRYLERLKSGKHPLISWKGPDSLPKMDGSANKKLNKWKLEITDIGKDVLANKADWIELNGTDRWLGGVHMIQGGSIWRWDASEGKLYLR